jgi:hypothetical protein
MFCQKFNQMFSGSNLSNEFRKLRPNEMPKSAVRPRLCKFCTNPPHLSPTTALLSAQQHSILLKTRTTQNVIRTTNQKVGSSTLSGRTT